MTSNGSLYITLQYLRTENGRNKYHWGLYATGGKAPSGVMYHATDLGKAPLDLYYQSKPVKDPMRSLTMVVCLKIADASSLTAIDDIVKGVPLMSRRYLPADEKVWTCRVWVKEALRLLHEARLLRLPAAVSRIEDSCLYTADSYVPYRISKNPRMNQPRVFNDLGWISGGSNRTTPMETDTPQPSRTQQPYYGSKPMAIDSTQSSRAPQPYYGSKPMVIDSTQSSRAPQPYYGSKPMVIDSTQSSRAPQPYYGSNSTPSYTSYASDRMDVDPTTYHGSQPTNTKSTRSRWFR